MEIGGSMLSSLSLTGSDGIVRTSGNQVVRGVKNFVDGIITPLVYEPTGLLTVLAEGGDVNINALNNISISNGYGINTIDSVLGSNVLSVYSSTKIETTSSTNTLNNATSNILQVGGMAKITTTSVLTTIENTNILINGTLCQTSTTSPLANWTISGTANLAGAFNFQCVMNGNGSVRCFTMPYNARCVGWSIAGSNAAHIAFIMRAALSTAVGRGGTIYYDQEGTLTANRLQDNSAYMDINNGSIGWTGVFFQTTPISIPKGVTLFCYLNTSVSLTLNCSVTYFFQQV